MWRRSGGYYGTIKVIVIITFTIINFVEVQRKICYINISILVITHTMNTINKCNTSKYIQQHFSVFNFVLFTRI